MPKFVAALSGDEDEVIIVPFVKPPPPVILLSGSEDEDDELQSAVIRPQTTENVSHSTPAEKRVSNDVPSLLDVGGTGTQGQDMDTRDKDHVQPNISKSIFDPSETAMMDVTRNSTPTGSVDSTPVPSPTSASTNSGKKNKGRHSNLVEEQFASFLKDINLPPPPRVRKTKHRSPKTSTTADKEVDVPSAIPASTEIIQGIVSVTVEKSKPTAKRSKTKKAPSTPQPPSVPLAEREESPSMDVQFNRTVTTVPNQGTTKNKGTKRSLSSSGSEKRQGKTSKKRKQDVTVDKSRPSSTSKDNSSKRQKRKSDADADDPSPQPDSNPSTSTDPPVIDSGMPSHWNDEMKQFYGTIATKQFKLTSILSKMPGHSRHWKTPKDKGVPRNRRREPCDICKKYDHRTITCIRRGCPTKCIYCSSEEHSKDACTEGICLFCGCGTSRGTVAKTCPECLDRRPKPISCGQCGVAGHNGELCPDNWRRYHSTTIDVERVAKELNTLKLRLERKKTELESSPARNDRISDKTSRKTATECDKLQQEIKTLERKLKKHGRQDVNGSLKYVPRYKQYCSNCSAKGHAYINCTKSPPNWTRSSKVIPNKPYIINELPASKKRPRTPTSTTTDTNDSNNEISSSSNVTPTRRIVLDMEEDLTTITVTNNHVTNKNPNKPELEPGATPDSGINAPLDKSRKEKPPKGRTTEPLPVVSNEALRTPDTQNLSHGVTTAVTESQATPPGDGYFRFRAPARKVATKEITVTEGDEVTSSMTITIDNSEVRDHEIGVIGLEQGDSEQAVREQGVSELAVFPETGAHSSASSSSASRVVPEQGSSPGSGQPAVSSGQSNASQRVSMTRNDRMGSGQEFYEDIPLEIFDESAGPGQRMPPRAPPPFSFQPGMLRFPPPRPPPLMRHPLFGVPQFWNDGGGRGQFPQFQSFHQQNQPTMIPVPVPVPVRAEDFERVQREGFPPGFSFQEYFGSVENRYLANEQIPRFHVPEWPSEQIPRSQVRGDRDPIEQFRFQLPGPNQQHRFRVPGPSQPRFQVPGPNQSRFQAPAPREIPQNVPGRNEQPLSQVPGSSHAPGRTEVDNQERMAQPQVQAPASTMEDPPSPDSTETPMSESPASPEIIFLEEVRKQSSDQTAGSDSTVSTSTVPGEAEEEAKISLLRSEWELFIRDKGKSDLVDMLSKQLGVTIKVCKETMSVTIFGKDESAKAISKRNIVEFLQKEAAGLNFVPNLRCLPEDLPKKDKWGPPTVKGPSTNPSPGKSKQRNISNLNSNESSAPSDRDQRGDGHGDHHGGGQNPFQNPYRHYPYHHANQRFREDHRMRNYEEHDRGDRGNYRRNSSYYHSNRAHMNQNRYRQDEGDPRRETRNPDRNYRGGQGHGYDNARRYEGHRDRPHYSSHYQKPRRYFEP